MFNHIDLEFEELVTRNENGERKYVTPDGNFPSITTILSRKKAKFFKEWRERIGAEEANASGNCSLAESSQEEAGDGLGLEAVRASVVRVAQGWDLWGNQISVAPRHRCDVVPSTASARRLQVEVIFFLTIAAASRHRVVGTASSASAL